MEYVLTYIEICGNMCGICVECVKSVGYVWNMNGICVACVECVQRVWNACVEYV